MDILRKELQAVFARQRFDKAELDAGIVDECRAIIGAQTSVSQGCAILSDIATNSSYYALGRLVDILDLHSEIPKEELIDIDEDFIYRRIHPEDLVDKRMLELRFFEFVSPLAPAERLKYHACCRIRMKTGRGNYVYVSNITKVQKNTSGGKMRLIVCLYDFSPEQDIILSINPKIVNTETGEVKKLSLYNCRYEILSEREKEILRLIRLGVLSKEIADRLSISVHTVSRHRQNILRKLSVSNSLEAVKTAQEMLLI